MEYRSCSTCEKIIENVKRKSNVRNTKEKIVKENTKCEIVKNVKLAKKCNRKIVKQDIGIGNSNFNGKCKRNGVKIENVNIGLKIIERIARIGSALSGLLPSIRTVFVKRIAIMI